MPRIAQHTHTHTYAHMSSPSKKKKKNRPLGWRARSHGPPLKAACPLFFFDVGDDVVFGF